MSDFRIYKHPSGQLEAVKEGWSWPAAAFVVFWALYKKIWVIGSAILIFSVLLYASLPLSYLPYAFDLGCALVFGFFGNGWREANLVDRGYELINDVSARTPAGALAEHLRSQSQTQGSDAAPVIKSFPQLQ
jgi:hypothetical protein